MLGYKRTISSRDGKWIPSLCKMCISGCGIRVQVVDGVAVKIEGDPTNPDNMGKLCPKGNAGLLRLYDPHRVKAPLKRTNLRKGVDVDPGWKEISWEEALDLVVEKLKAIRETDPRKLLVSVGDFQRFYLWVWPAVFGTPHYFSTIGTYCGAAVHTVTGAVQGAFQQVNDYDYCNYWIQIGAGDGFSSHLHLSGSAKRMADARLRGMKLVVLDPVLSVAAAKADEWIPIRPATDRAFVFGMMNVLLHEMNLYDAEFIGKQTNGPYLVGPDGYFVRDKTTAKPLVWDSIAGRPRAFDDPGGAEPALKGHYRVDGVECRPAFQILKDLVREYTPEAMSEITSVPAEMIRRIAREFGEAARVGSKIVIDGVEYPYRPAAVNYYRGAQSHAHGAWDNMAFKLINMIVGNLDVPGGHLGVPLDQRGLFIEEGPDGMLKPFPHQLRPPLPFKYPPDSGHLGEFFPVGFEAGQLHAETLLNPQKFGLNFEPEALLLYHCNPLWNMPGTSKLMEIFGRLKFIVAIDVLVNESSVWADVILPDHTYLESYTLWCGEAPVITGLAVRQPVVQPLYNTRDAGEILTELADRLGFLGDWNDFLNFVLGLVNKPELMLKPDRRYRAEELMDRFAKATHGEEHGLEWFKEHGHMVRVRTPKETYQPYGKLRLPLYFEFVKQAGDDLKEKLQEHDVQWDTSDYLPLPIWKPNPMSLEPAEFDMYAICFKSALHNFAETVSIPWLSDVSERDPVHMGILINTRTAQAKGIRGGDEVVVRSPYGQVKGPAILTEGIHPEVVALSNALARWQGTAAVKPRDLHFNSLLPASLEYTDKVMGAFETAARVRVDRAHK